MSKKNINVENQSADEITKKDNDVEVSENQLNDLESTISSSNDETNEQSADEITKRYVVVHKFMDLEDSNHIYRINDIYPRENIDEKTKVNALSESRITALMTTNNRIGEILVKLDEE